MTIDTEKLNRTLLLFRNSLAQHGHTDAEDHFNFVMGCIDDQSKTIAALIEMYNKTLDQLKLNTPEKKMAKAVEILLKHFHEDPIKVGVWLTSQNSKMGCASPLKMYKNGGAAKILDHVRGEYER